MARILAALALCLAGAARAQTLMDPSLTLTTVVPYGGLSQPTTMAFIGANDFLVTERTGAVRRVLNGALQPLPVLILNVDTLGERGLLGIEVNTQVPPRVFLYVSEAATPGGTAVANRLYRYTWDSVSATLTGQTLLLELPAFFGPHHNGGSDTNFGNLYSFPLNVARTGFVLPGALADGVADTPSEAELVRLGQAFAGVTDLEVGPDGHVYVVEISGRILRISGPRDNDVTALPGAFAAALIAAVAVSLVLALARRAPDSRAARRGSPRHPV